MWKRNDNEAWKSKLVKFLLSRSHVITCASIKNVNSSMNGHKEANTGCYRDKELKQGDHK